MFLLRKNKINIQYSFIASPKFAALCGRMVRNALNPPLDKRYLDDFSYDFYENNV